MSEKKMDISAIQKALETGLSTNVYEILIPSMGKKVPFKPLLTGQCKTMAKIMIDANEKPFDTFRAVVAMIKATCMDEELDLNELTELDRVKIMLEFYTNNNILKDFNIACPKCKKSNKINIDLDKIVSKMESVPTESIMFTNGQPNVLNAVIDIPKLPVMHEFYKSVQNGTSQADDIPGCFITGITLVFENVEVEPISILLKDFDEIQEYLDAIQLIPYNITVNTESGLSVFDIIMETLDSVMTNDDVSHTCTECGVDFGEVASAQNFI